MRWEAITATQSDSPFPFRTSHPVVTVLGLLLLLQATFLIPPVWTPSLRSQMTHFLYIFTFYLLRCCF